MSVNPQLPKEQQVIEHLRQIGTALQNISRDIGHEMGPFKVQPISTIAEEMKPEWDSQQEANRREEEIEELKKSNKIAERTTRLAVYGLFISALIGAAQLMFTIWQHFNKNEQEKIIVVQEQMTTGSAKLFNK